MSNYYEKYLKYKNKYLQLKGQIGGTIVPTRFAYMQFDESRLVNDTFPLGYRPTIISSSTTNPFMSQEKKEELNDRLFYEQSRDGFKNIASFRTNFYINLRHLIIGHSIEPENLVLMYKSKTTDNYSFDFEHKIPFTDRQFKKKLDDENQLVYILYVTDLDDKENLRRIFDSITEKNFLCNQLIVSIYPFNIDNCETAIDIMILIGFLYSYWPIDIYGFVSNAIKINNMAPVKKCTAVGMTYTQFKKRFLDILNGYYDRFENKETKMARNARYYISYLSGERPSF